MNSNMTLNDYQLSAERTMQFGLNEYDRTIHSTCMLGGEVGEVLSIFQKVRQGHKLDKEDLKKELGDILFAVAEIATFNELELDEIAKTNINKLIARYPHGFEKARSVNRDE